MKVVVVGAGMAGVAAALAAREHGAEVLVLGDATGASRLAGGAWDVATVLGEDRVPGQAPSLRDAIRAFSERRAAHPYGLLGKELMPLVEMAHDRVLSALGHHHPIDLSSPGVLVATEHGLVRRAATAQRQVLALNTLPAGTDVGVLCLGDEVHPAEYLVRSLAEAAPRFGLDLSFAAVAGPALAELASISTPWPPEVLSAFSGLGALLLGPGTAAGGADLTEIVQRNLQIPAGEWITVSHSQQGRRLVGLMEEALRSRGCERLAKRALRVEVVPALRVTCEDGSQPAADALVLATGKFIGGGVRVLGGSPREPLGGFTIFDQGDFPRLPSSPYGSDPLERFGCDPREGSAGYRLGVGVDRRLRLLGPDGSPVAPGLFAAGDVLSGVDSVRDGAGFGCAAVTGYLAGMYAAEGG